MSETPVRITASGGGGGGGTALWAYAPRPGEWIWVKSPSDWFMEFHMIRRAGDLLTICGRPRGTPVVCGTGGAVCCKVCFSARRGEVDFIEGSDA